MIAFSCTSSVEAEQANVQSRWIILGILDKAVGRNRAVVAILSSQSTVYSPLCRLTEQPWEGEALENISTWPTGTTIGDLTSCLNMLTGHTSGFADG